MELDWEIIRRPITGFAVEGLSPDGWFEDGPCSLDLAIYALLYRHFVCTRYLTFRPWPRLKTEFRND